VTSYFAGFYLLRSEKANGASADDDATGGPNNIVIVGRNRHRERLHRLS
jgi:hypothetical protein